MATTITVTETAILVVTEGPPNTLYIDAKVATEAAARAAADTTLQTAIDNEVSARAAAINSEANTRNTADATLQTEINAEVTARAAAIDTEAAARDTGDQANAAAITAEATTRAAALLLKKDLSSYTAHAVHQSNVALTGLPTADELSLTAGQVILLTAQSTTHQNGPWVVAAGAWTRPTWYPAAGTVQAFEGAAVLILGGYNYGGTIWRITTTGAITIGTTGTAWARAYATTGVAVPVEMTGGSYAYGDNLQDFAYSVDNAFGNLWSNYYYLESEVFNRPTYTEVTNEIIADIAATGSRTAVSVTTATNYNLAATGNLNRRRFFDITITAFTGTATASLTTANAQAGDEAAMWVTVPAGNSGILQIRNATSGGTLLATVPVDSAVARTWVLRSRYSGTAWGACAIAPLDGKAALDERFNNWVRDTGWIYSDGATPNRSQIQVPGSRGNLAGAALAEWCGWVLVPSSQPSQSIDVFGAQSSATQQGFLTNHSLSAAIVGATDQLYINAKGADQGIDRRVFSWASFRSTYSGKRVWLEVLFTNGTSNPVVKVDGVDISAFFSLSVNGTVPDWLSSSLDSTYQLTGFNWPAGEAPLGCWLNAHLTQSESDDWRTKGKIPAWVALGGSCENAIIDVARNSAFTAGATDWTTGTVANASVTLNTTTHKLDIVSNVNGYDNLIGNYGIGFIPLYPSLVRGLFLNNATVFRISFDITNYTGGSWSLGPENVSSFPQGNVTANGSYSVEGTGIQISSGVIFIQKINGASGSSFSLSNVKIELVGALSLPSVQPIPVLDDVTRVGGNPARLVGMTPITNKRDWRIVKSTATNGNEQLLGGSLFIDVDRNRIDSWVINNLGSSRTVSLGNTSAGTQYASGITAASGLNDVTPTTRFPSTVDLWVNSNGTDTLVHTITGHRVGNQ